MANVTTSLHTINTKYNNSKIYQKRLEKLQRYASTNGNQEKKEEKEKKEKKRKIMENHGTPLNIMDHHGIEN